MKERPMLFSSPMVRAIIAGQKTQTRRVVKPVGNDEGFVLVQRGDGEWWPWRSDDGESSFHTVKRDGGEYRDETPHRCPYGKPGDRLWVRETWREFIDSECVDGVRHELGRDVLYRADGDSKFAWRPSIFMPRWASRIVLEVVSVRVERLNDISEEDATAEGSRLWADEQDTPARDIPCGETRMIYRQLWEAINGAGSWEKNPWVWVVEFKRIESPKNGD